MNESVRTLWKAEMENENDHGYEQLLAHASEGGYGRLAEHWE